MSLRHSPQQNQLLAALASADEASMIGQLELVPMALGDMLYESGEPLQHAYFPTTAIVSLHYVMASGESCETSGVGQEGVVGMPLFTGGVSTSGSAVVQTAGHAYRLHRRLVRQEFDRAGAMQRVCLRYLQTLMMQTTQTAVCNRHHSIHQNLCRWLLSTLDRIPSGELRMTQELIAGMLGVRREGITDAAVKLQTAGYIRYRRGHISVLDRAGLESHACECYGVVRKALDRLLSDVQHVACAPDASVYVPLAG
jgi:CRP-like cAMP-binding protein